MYNKLGLDLVPTMKSSDIAENGHLHFVITDSTSPLATSKKKAKKRSVETMEQSDEKTQDLHEINRNLWDWIPRFNAGKLL